jgi:predicted metal-binding protein
MHKIKSVSIENLMEFFNPAKVSEYCKECPNYNNLWSCPPHNFNPEEHIKKFKEANIICLKIDISHLNDKKNAIKLFHKKRKKFNLELLSLETKIANSTVLYSGECHFCDSCTRQKGLPCSNKEYLRYSLESLGFKVSDICENILNEKLEWYNTKKQNYLLSVAAIFTESKVNNEIIQKTMSTYR